MNKEITLISPATSANLGPGFDCLGLALERFNKVTIRKSNIKKINVKGFGEDNKFIKKNNLFVSIFDEVLRDFSASNEQFCFEFCNEIPLSRGMGSSSSVIVAAIMAAHAMLGISLNKDAILNKALVFEPHPDNISPAILGGFVVSSIDGTPPLDAKVRYMRCDVDENLRAVICVPNKQISTNASRAALRQNVALADASFNLSRTALITAAFFSKNYDALRGAALDRLHENRRMQALPELFKVREIALENGALMSNLSGSGSSFLSLCYKDDAAKIEKALRNSFAEFDIFTLKISNEGAKIL